MKEYKLGDEKMNIAFAGTGYVGLVTGVVLAQIGHNVTCVDIDEQKLELMRQGKSPIYEAGLEELMKQNKERLTYTTNYKDAYADAEVIFIGVGTPERADGSANLDYVYNVCDQIIESINKDTIVVIKSTVPIGTNEDIEKYFNEKLTDIRVDVVSIPEFLAQGTAVEDSLYASRIVVGAENKGAHAIIKELYKPLTEEPYNVPYIEMNRRSAEMVKYASNCFLALKIAYVNEIANFCEDVNANIDDVTNGMGYDPRIGDKFLNAGIGYGGSCFPKDTSAMYWLSKNSNNELTTLKATIEVNKKQKTKMFYKLYEYFNKDISGKKVAVLGLTFKPNTDDLREAPSIDNVKLLIESGAIVHAYDPLAEESFKNVIQTGVVYFNSPEEAIQDVDAVMIMTEWAEIKNVKPEQYTQLLKKPLLFDGRNCYDVKEMKANGIEYFSIGR